ncbi:hypothetical protein GCM10010399_53690 [Dactylosporangium fulvum]
MHLERSELPVARTPYTAAATSSETGMQRVPVRRGLLSADHLATLGKHRWQRNFYS